MNLHTILKGYFSVRVALVVAMFSFFAESSGQGPRVVAALGITSTNDSPSVHLKWYSRDIYYEEGVQVYRREVNSLGWSKVTSTPIHRKQSIEPSVLANDNDLDLLVRLITTSKRHDLMNDLTMLDIFLKSFQSNAFADFLGIYFNDTTVTLGSTYQYKINKIFKGREVLLALSPLVKAEPYHSDSAIDSLKVFQQGKKVTFNWRFEEDRYYAVNVYRTNLLDSATEKLNARPLLISKVKDATGKLNYPDPMFAEEKNLKEGSVYAYRFAGCGFFGEETERTKPVYITYKDVTPPPAPVELTGKPDSIRVRLKWKNKPVPDFKGVKHLSWY